MRHDDRSGLWVAFAMDLNDPYWRGIPFVPLCGLHAAWVRIPTQFTPANDDRGPHGDAA